MMNIMEHHYLMITNEQNVCIMIQNSEFLHHDASRKCDTKQTVLSGFEGQQNPIQLVGVQSLQQYYWNKVVSQT